MGFDWVTVATCIATCASAFAAVVALFVSVRQSCLSNKQSLFDRRLTIWLTVSGLLELYKSNKSQLKKNDEPQPALELDFVWLTNNAFLCDIGPAASHPLEAEHQKPMLTKLEELKRLALEAKLVFKGAPAKAITRFVVDYQMLLSAIYRYQVVMKHVKESTDSFHWTLERSCGEVGEPGQREELITVSDAIAESYRNLSNEKVLKKIEKQVRLVS